MDNINGTIEYRAAGAVWERKQAYRLLYESDPRKGDQPLDRNKIRFNDHLASPNAITFIAVRRGTVIGTMTLFMDGKIGLPIDKIFKPEIRKLRNQWQTLAHRSVAEVGAVAQRVEDPARRAEVLMTLSRLCATYAIIHGVTDCLMSVNLKQDHMRPEVLGFDSFAANEKESAMAYRLTQESIDPERPRFRWFFGEGPVMMVPDRPPHFSFSDRAYFRSLSDEATTVEKRPFRLSYALTAAFTAIVLYFKA